MTLDGANKCRAQPHLRIFDRSIPFLTIKLHGSVEKSRPKSLTRLIPRSIYMSGPEGAGVVVKSTTLEETRNCLCGLGWIGTRATDLLGYFSMKLMKLFCLHDTESPCHPVKALIVKFSSAKFSSSRLILTYTPAFVSSHLPSTWHGVEQEQHCRFRPIWRTLHDTNI